MMPLIFLLTAAAVIFALVRWRRSRAIFVLAFGLWVALPLYNKWILSDCSGDCGIRIDLIPVGIVLLLASGFALFEAARRWRDR
jgi:hypothetical protein